MITMLDWIAAHKVGLLAAVATVHGGLIHIYLTVTKLGGVKKLWSNFFDGPKTISQDNPADKKQNI